MNESQRESYSIRPLDLRSQHAEDGIEQLAVTAFLIVRQEA